MPPPPGPDVPPCGGRGTAPPRLSAGPRRWEGPAPLQGNVTCPPPGTRAMVPTQPLPPPHPCLPGEAPPPEPRPPSSLASWTPPLPPIFYYGTAHCQHHLLLCMDTPTRSPPQFVTRAEVPPTPQLKAAEPPFSTKRTSQRAGGVGVAAREGLFFPRTSLPTHTFTPTTPPPPAALGSNPVEKARRGEGQRRIWPSLTNELGAAKGRGLSLTLPCSPGPGLVFSLQGDPRPPPGCGSTLPHPLSRPLSSPLNLCTASAVAGFLPSQGCKAPLGAALSSTFSKAHSRQVLQMRWLVQGLSFLIKGPT